MNMKWWRKLFSLRRPEPREGTVFLVPSEEGHFLRGVIARVNGHVYLGYFFLPEYATKKAATLDDLTPANVVLRARFGELGFVNHSWPTIGTLSKWKREDWPVPSFVSLGIFGGRGPVRVRYSDDLDVVEAKEIITIEEASQLPEDRVFGAKQIFEKVRSGHECDDHFWKMLPSVRPNSA
jgi:hypothetical protein